jgi:hypothetical protein
LHTWELSAVAIAQALTEMDTKKARALEKRKLWLGVLTFHVQLI